VDRRAEPCGHLAKDFPAVRIVLYDQHGDAWRTVRVAATMASDVCHTLTLARPL
jgi:hypothetical protein